MRQNRLDRPGALRLLREATQLELMERANALRQAFHPGGEVTFVIDSNPNYTNVCVTKCTFCSFYRAPGQEGGYVLTPEQMAVKAAQAERLGATTLLLQGGHHPDLPLEYFVDLIDTIRSAAPSLHLHFFSPAEVAHIAETNHLDVEAVLHVFVACGLTTMPGGGAEILVDRVRRKIAPKKISAEAWLDVMRIAHRMGMKTSATMTYGHVETEADIVEHLFRLRELQDETGGFYAFIPWSFKPANSPLSRLRPAAELPSYYVRIIALSRLVLDNIPHIQASWFGEGYRAGQLALHAGADDFGGVLLEENVLHQAQHNLSTNVNEVQQIIREAGFTPVQRTTLYEKLPNSTTLENPLMRSQHVHEVHSVHSAKDCPAGLRTAV